MRSLLDGILQNSLDGVMAFQSERNRDGEIVDFRWRLTNPVAETIMGRTHKELFGRRLGRIRPKCIDEDLFERFVEVVETGVPMDIERLCRDEIGRCWYRIMAVKLGDGFTLTYSDISGRKKLEDERRLLQGQIEQTQRLESLGALAGGIAHEFNNVLQGVMGSADLALMDLEAKRTAQAEKSVRVILKTAKRAAELCLQLLTYSGKSHAVMETLDLSSVLKSARPLLANAVSQQASLSFRLDPQLPLIEGDASQLRQVVLNLVTNASEALKGKEGEICISTGRCRLGRSDLARVTGSRGLSPGEYVELRVEDSGCGVSPTILPQIFDPFFTTKYTARGLGLAAVLGIVRGHGGCLLVESGFREGSVFRVFLPLAEETVGERPAAVKPVSDRPLAWTVLVIDNDETVRNTARGILRRAGCQVMCAAGGEEGLKIFRSRGKSIDLVLLDRTMSHMSGRETFKQLKSQDAGIKVVLSSGYTDEETLDEFWREGLAGFIHKPYRAHQLIEMVRDVMTRDPA